MSTQPTSSRINRLVPFVHVADVEASLAFYSLLGLHTGEVMRDHRDAAFWASASTSTHEAPPGGEIMFARASGPIAPDQQAILFYMYCSDIAALRSHLLAAGLHDGGDYRGQHGPNNGRRVVFRIAHPHHMTHGELRIADPDGYCILVGQLQSLEQ